MVVYEQIPDEYDFNSKFDTYILAFCPDTDSWFATNERFFYYEYPMEFPNEVTAIEYFCHNPDVFLKLEKDMNVYRPSFRDNVVFLENIRKLIKVNE